MQPDVKLKDYYLNYIHNAEQDMNDYGEDLIRTVEDRKNTRVYIEQHIGELVSVYNIDLNQYTKEWVNEEYNPKETLYKVVFDFVNQTEVLESRTVILQLLKYLIKLKEEDRLTKLLEVTTRRANISLKEYKEYLVKYYNKVHQIVLEGNGYKIGGGIGVLLINYWKVPKSNSLKRCDFRASYIAKQELIKQGLTPYDEEEAKRYKEQGLEYDGIKYLKYKTNECFYEIIIIDSDIFNARELVFNKTQYVNLKYKGMTCEQMANTFINSKEDIYNFQVSLNHKLNILLQKYPNSYLNFIRNASAEKYEC